MKQQSSPTPATAPAAAPYDAGHEDQNKRAVERPVPPLPTVGPPQDGRQFQNIVEEQDYSGQRPSREEQQPRCAGSERSRP
jgi:hypothetical protein